jgi:muramidase (phage lysozyme)
VTTADRPRDKQGRWIPNGGSAPRPPRRSPSEREADRAKKQQAKEAETQQRQKNRDAQKQRDAIELGVTKALKKTGAWGAFWDLIALSFHAGICVYAVEQTNAIADLGFGIRSNAQAITAGFDSCARDPIGCIQGKHLPLLRWGKPTDNTTAMLGLIAWAEGTDDRYNVIYTGAKFDSFDQHPARVMCSAGICSDAAGRYQFLSTTWQPLKTKLNLLDFSPQSQDRAAIELIKQCGGYSAAVRGDVASFADRCWSQWASLQSASGQKLDKRQRSYSIAKLQAKYQEFLSTPKMTPPLLTMTITSPMSPSRRNPATGEIRPHNGADYACPLGMPVMSPIAGTFRQGNSDPKGFGNNWGTIEGDNLSITIGHTQKLLVGNGSIVHPGQPIAECGAEGSSTGPHLHIEIRRQGQLIDPAAEFKSN